MLLMYMFMYQIVMLIEFMLNYDALSGREREREKGGRIVRVRELRERTRE